MKIKKFHYEGHEVRGFTSSSFARREAGASRLHSQTGALIVIHKCPSTPHSHVLRGNEVLGIRVGRAVRALGNYVGCPASLQHDGS